MEEKELQKILNGKTDEQVKVLKYLLTEGGCFDQIMSDEQYISLVHQKRDSLGLKDKALSKIGLDESQVGEVPPASFEGFIHGGEWSKQQANGDWVSSAYQVSWIFCSNDQIYLYQHTFNLDENKTRERTDEFFYKDVTSFSTSSETEKPKTADNKEIVITSHKFAMIVPGDKLFMATHGNSGEAVIQALKHKLREKKQSS